VIVRIGTLRNRLIWLVATPTAMALIASLASLAASKPKSVVPRLSAESERSAAPWLPLEIRPDPVVLGAIPAHQTAQISIGVENLRTVPVILERVETSCPCITVGDLPASLEPEGATDLRVTFDPTHEPDFVGALAVQVVGYLSDGQVGFRTRVKLEVGRRGGGQD
jgi:hypothetical protein